MGLLESLSDGINKGIGQTDRMLQIGRIKSALTSLSKSRAELYESLGKHVYESNRRAPVAVDGLESYAGKIRTIELEIARLESELDAGLHEQGASVTCPKCGASNALGSSFCVGCGSKLEIAEVLKCTHCDSPLVAGSRFCTRCGTSVGEPEPEGADEAAADEIRNVPANVSSQGEAYCPSCGGAVSEGLRFCPTCGTGIQE